MLQKKKTDHSSDKASVVCQKAAMPAFLFCCRASIVNKGNHGVVSSKKKVVRGVVLEPCLDWEVEWVLPAAATALRDHAPTGQV